MRNNEILRANNRDQSGVNGEFLCGKGRFGFDFTTNAERVRQPLVRRNGKLEPASWEDALEEVARRLKQVRDKHGANAIGVIGSNHTTNEENYLLNRFARATLGTNNIDHHRTADYAGLAAALGPNANSALATMADVYTAPAVLLVVLGTAYGLIGRRRRRARTDETSTGSGVHGPRPTGTLPGHGRTTADTAACHRRAPWTRRTLVERLAGTRLLRAQWHARTRRWRLTRHGRTRLLT